MASLPVFGAFALLALLANVSAFRFKRHISRVSTPIPANFTITNFRQKVDHFSVANDDYFDQRVITSTDHWGGDGSPIFFYAGNEGNIFDFANNTGWMWERAADFSAMVIFVEHRYYGTSQPYGNDSYKSLDKLGYLNSEQALADYATFLQDLKLNYPGAQNSPVIAFGGSYGGMLASWFRIKYPHLVEGALAASAPIFQFPGIYDCQGYFNVITSDFKQYSEECAQSIKNSWPALRRVANSSQGRQWLQDTFNICESLSSDEAIEKFVTWISEAYESLGMTDYPNPATFLQPLPAYPMKETCKKLTNPQQADKPLLMDIFQAVSVFYNYTGSVACNTIAPNEMDRGWSFQFCTEMVLPVCSDGVNDIFERNPWNLTEVSDDCFKLWKVRPDPLKALAMYGGKNISTASNIIFSNGDRDPWSAGGVLDQVGGASIEIIKVPHACHHEDLRPTGPNDSPELLAVRETEASIIRGWINAYYERRGYAPKDWIKKARWF